MQVVNKIIEQDTNLQQIHDNITDLISDMLTTFETLSVDEDGRVIDNYNEKQLTISYDVDDTLVKNAYVYKTNISEPDVAILNPLNESVSTSIEARWFYTRLSSTLSSIFLQILGTLLSECISSKNSKTNKLIVNTMKDFVNEVDEKMLEELARIEKAGSNEFLNIYYNRLIKSSILKLGFEDIDDNGVCGYIEELKGTSKSPKIRAKTFGVLQKLIKKILDVKDDDTVKDVYTEVSMHTSVGYPHFQTYYNLWVRIVEKLAPYVDIVFNDDITSRKVKAIKSHKDNLEIYVKKVRWLSQTSNVKHVVANKLDNIQTSSNKKRVWEDTPVEPTLVPSAPAVYQQPAVPQQVSVAKPKPWEINNAPINNIGFAPQMGNPGYYAPQQPIYTQQQVMPQYNTGYYPNPNYGMPVQRTALGNMLANQTNTLYR